MNAGGVIERRAGEEEFDRTNSQETKRSKRQGIVEGLPVCSSDTNEYEHTDRMFSSLLDALLLVWTSHFCIFRAECFPIGNPPGGLQTSKASAPVSVSAVGLEANRSMSSRWFTVFHRILLCLYWSALHACGPSCAPRVRIARWLHLRGQSELICSR